MMMRKYVAEFLGTFALVFAGTGAVVIDAVTAGGVTHAGVALTFGLILAMPRRSLELLDRSGADGPVVTLVVQGDALSLANERQAANTSLVGTWTPGLTTSRCTTT